jgi:hypothetical protein
MKKADLKSGMLLKHRNGEFSIVLLNSPRGDVFTTGYQSPHHEPLKRTWGPLDVLNDDLEYNQGSYTIADGDVMQVYGLPGSGNMDLLCFSLFDRRVIWDRNNPEE